MNIPTEYLTKPFQNWQLNLVSLFVASQVAGRVYTGLRSEGGLRGIARAIWTGSATASPRPVDAPAQVETKTNS